MPGAIFFNVPGHGHVNPSLPLVAELTRRGHAITYLVTEDYRTRIEATGATFRPYRIDAIQDDYFTGRNLSGSVPQKVALALVSTAEQILPELLDMTTTENPDYILFDGLCPWGSLVAQVLRLPSVALVGLAPNVSPPPRAMLTPLPLILPMILRDFGAGMEARQRAKALTTQYAVRPFGFVGVMNNTGDINISYTSRYFQPYADTAPDSMHFVGWTLSDSPADDAFSFERVQGRRLIYVSLGTLNTDDVSIFRKCIEAVADSDCFVIITTGKGAARASFGTLPENVAVFDWVPQVEVVRRADLFISHGGLNSIHESLSLGVPLLLVPQQEEQMLNAMRVVELGAGILLK